MPDQRPRDRCIPLILVLILFGATALIGIGWGLPSRSTDTLLFADQAPWDGAHILALSGASTKNSASRGADVDADPLTESSEPILLNRTSEQAAAIFLRYRLFSHQPDEMITMMALSQMKPAAFDFDPQLYQYGGLFIYPVGAIIKTCGLLGLIDVRSDLAFYLDHPAQFGRFYIAARAYVAAWGLTAVLAVFLIGQRLGGHRTGLLAALLFTLMPIVICMSHEAKPHLPGAALMLWAVWIAMRFADTQRRRDWLAMCAVCGASLGIVLSCLPIFILIPFVQYQGLAAKKASLRFAVMRSLSGLALAGIVYLVSNPYVAINLLANPEVLRSNLGNSLAMYEIDRLGAGFLRMVQLSAYGATWPMLIVGIVGLGLAALKRLTAAWPMVVVALLLFLQFVLIGAGKPAEYGRFGIFTDTVLALSAAYLLTVGLGSKSLPVRTIPILLLGTSLAYAGFQYLDNFAADATTTNTRHRAAALLPGSVQPLALLAEPAPYSVPPLNFANQRLWLFDSVEQWEQGCRRAKAEGDDDYPRMLLSTKDTIERPWYPLIDSLPPYPYITPISWANKPVCYYSDESDGPSHDEQSSAAQGFSP